MRYAVISDIHSNLEALDAALAEIDGLGVDRIVSLGDAVGYNANPNECVRILCERNIPTLMGNHDAVAAGLEEPDNFNAAARRAVLWTRHVLDKGNALFLREQPESRTVADGVRLVHGSLLHRDHYLLSKLDLRENVLRMRGVRPEIRLVFFGHTHYQVAYLAQGNELSLVPGKTIHIEENTYCIVNPGSVGQPRDRDARAAFLIYDDTAGTIELLRTSYDIDACTQKIISAGLPHELAERLYKGW